MKPCPRRQEIIAFEADGSKETRFFCNEDTAAMHGQQVVAEDCAACPVREAIATAAFDRLGKITPQLSGAIKTERDPGSGEFGYPECGQRLIVTVRACCGTTGSVWVCDHRASRQFQNEVTAATCRLCPLKS